MTNRMMATKREMATVKMVVGNKEGDGEWARAMAMAAREKATAMTWRVMKSAMARAARAIARQLRWRMCHRPLHYGGNHSLMYVVIC